MIIGQTKIIKNINNIDSIDKLSKSVIFVGRHGSGKHTIFNYICDRFGFECEIINYELSTEVLNSMYNLSIPKMYLIDFDKLGENKRIERFQNTLLKFLEEPPRFAWITILTSNPSILLNTIKNRCKIYILEEYSLSELEEICNLYDKDFSREQLKLLETPGNIIRFEKEDLETTQKLAESILNNMSRANIPNALSIKQKFFDKCVDIELFISVFRKVIVDNFYLSNDKNKFNALVLTKELENNLLVLGINKSVLIENYLLNLKLELTK